MQISLLLCLLYALASNAQDFSLDKTSGKVQPNFLGQAKLISGKIYKKQSGELSVVKIGARFYPADVVVTDKDSKVRILLVDDTSLTLGPESELQFTEFKFKDKKDRQAIFTLVKGQLSSNVKNEVRNGELNYRTRFIAMGVRGTELLINHRQLKNKEISEFALLSGKADIKDHAGKLSQLLPGRKMVFVHDSTQGADVSEEMPLTPAEKSELEKVINEDKDFKSLLPYLDLSSLPADSKLTPLLSQQNATGAAAAAEKKTDHPSLKNHWKDNLKLLNERLKKNRQEEAH